MRILVLLLTILLYPVFSSAQHGDNPILVSTEAPYTEDGEKVYQRIDYKLPFSGSGTVRLSFFQHREKDSVRLYELVFHDVPLRQGFHTLCLDLQKADSNLFINRSFMRAVKQFRRIPPGHYRTHIALYGRDTGSITEKSLLITADSALAVNTKLRNRINKALAKAHPSGAAPASKIKDAGKHPLTGAQLSAANSKAARSLRRIPGVVTRPEMKNGKAYVALYYEEWFLGRYEVMAAGALNQKITAEYHSIRNNASSLVESDLEDFRSISSQIRDLYKNEKDKYLSGNLNFTSAFATGQEQGSQQDDHFTEIRGNAEAEVFNIPVSIEGYYTTQDRNREAKAGYFRIHYDAQAAKNKITEIISGFKGKYHEAVARQSTFQSLYGNYLNKLNAEKATLISEITSYDAHLSLPDSSGDPGQWLSALSGYTDADGITDGDSLLLRSESRYRNAQQKKDSIAGFLKSKYEQLRETERRIQKYHALLDQYQEKLMLDSGLIYSKLERLTRQEDVSYKEMVKAAGPLLPEGSTRRLMNGLTHLDIGFIDQYQSDYTMSGQTLKGGSLGYDFGFVKAGISGGKTEYISREGHTDPYSSWLLRLDFKPVLKQKLGLIYYTYSPGRKVPDDINFIKTDIAVPVFVQPVHIISVIHEGDIAKNLSLKNEGAVSWKRTASARAFSKDNIALKTVAEYRIPRMKTSLRSEYEHAGKDFENSSLPYIKTAIERYALATEAELFKSFLTAGVQYNFLKQEAFAATGYHTKWGFDIRTNSRRYPNVSVSYKPYTTFRAYNDTFDIRQRPLAGEVWTAKGSYQIRRRFTSHRFMFIFNQNSTSTTDTQSYSSRTWQAGYIYMSGVNVLSINTGLLELPAVSGEGYGNSRSYFMNAAIHKRITSRTDLMLGQDAATGHYGLQRLSTTAGTGYRFKEMPVTLRVQVRYSNLKPGAEQERKNIWSGQISAHWQFKTKIFSQSDDSSQ